MKATGLGGLPFLPLLALAAVSGLIASPGLLVSAIAVSALVVPARLFLISDSGLARKTLRPRSFGGGLPGCLVTSLPGSLILGPAMLTLLNFDLPAFLNTTGLRATLEPLQGIAPSTGSLDALLFTVLLVPLAVTANLAASLALVVRILGATFLSRPSLLTDQP